MLALVWELQVPDPPRMAILFTEARWKVADIEFGIHRELGAQRSGRVPQDWQGLRFRQGWEWLSSMVPFGVRPSQRQRWRLQSS